MTPGQRLAGEAHDKLGDVIHEAMSEARNCRQRGDCEHCTARYSAALEAGENYARAAIAAQQPQTASACRVCDGSGMLTVPDSDGESASEQACPDLVHDDPFGGHEFHCESHTDLFRCIKCHRYEVTVREGETLKPCTGEPPAGSQPIEVNAW